MKITDLLGKWWAYPLMLVSVVALIFGSFAALEPALVTELKQRTAIEPTVHEWTAGPLKIIDIRTGTEINRIIIGSEGQMIAERLYINWQGEQEIRRIGTAR